MTSAEFAKVIRAVASFHETDLDLAAITVPTLVCYGEHEPPFLRRHVPALRSSIPNVTVREVPSAGHASNLDQPETFSRALEEFLASVGALEERPSPDDDRTLDEGDDSVAR